MERVKITDVCDFQGGTQPPKSEWKSEPSPGYLRMLQIRDFTQPDKNYIEYVVDKNTTKKCKADDILIGRYGASIGKICTGLAGAYNVALIKTIPNSKKLENKFLYYILKGVSFQNFILSVGSRAAQAGFNKDDLEKFEIPLPPLATQQKIASILDKADELRRYNQQLIEKYDALTQSLFLDMFGDPVRNDKRWKKVELGKLCDVGSSRRVFVDDLVNKGIPFYRGTEIGQMSTNDSIEPTLFITETHYEKLKKEAGVPEIGDLLMPSICPDGRIYEVLNEKPFYFKDGRVLWIKVNDKLINSAYLKKHLKSIFAIDYTKIASGTTFAELKIFALKKINLHYPPISLQNQFAERVHIIESQKQQAQEAFTKSEQLFQGLLQQAFKGELN